MKLFLRLCLALTTALAPSLILIIAITPLFSALIMLVLQCTDLWDDGLTYQHVI